MMKRLGCIAVTATALSLLFVAAWSVGRMLSTDALEMAVGMLLGTMSVIPVALIFTAGKREGQRPVVFVVQNEQPEVTAPRYTVLPARNGIEVQQ